MGDLHPKFMGGDIQDAIRRLLASRRADPAFQARLKERMEADRLILDRLKGEHYPKPCPSRARMYLGFPDPEGVEVPCGLRVGHLGRHVYHAEWADTAPESGEGR